jgi:integrator complex subunit 2
VGTLQSLAELDYELVKSDLATVGALVLAKQAALPASPPAVAEVSAATFEEASTDARRVFLVARELLRFAAVGSSTRGGKAGSAAGSDLPTSELLGAELLREDVLFILHAMMTFAPTVVPVEMMVECLLQASVSAPPPCNTDLLVCLAANVPERLAQVLDALVHTKSTPSASSTAAIAARSDAVLRLCRLAPHHAHSVRAKLVQHAALPELALKLTLELCHDVVPFLSGLLPNRQQWPWMAVVIRRDWNVQHPAAGQLYSAVAGALAAAVPLSKAGGNPRMGAAALARINCALYCTNSAQQPAAGLGTPLDTVVRGLTTAYAPTPAGARLVELALCTFASSPALMTGAGDPGLVTAWLGQLVDRLPEYGCGRGDSYADMLLLMATHFHSGDIKAVAELVRTTLGFRMDIPAEALKRLSSQFAVLYPPSVVSPMAVTVGVTEGLSAGTLGYTSIHCVHQCLRSRSFVMHQVAPAGWIHRQLLAAAPDQAVHPLLIATVQALADFATDPFGTELSGNSHVPRAADQDRCRIPLPKFTEHEITSFFEDDVQHPVARVLILLYVLTFNHAADARVRRLQQFPDVMAPATPAKYPRSLMDEIPVKQLVGLAERNSIFVGVFPALMSLVIELYPELVDGTTLAADEEHAATASSKDDSSLETLDVQAGHLLSGAWTSQIDCFDAAEQAVVTLQELNQLSSNALIQHAAILLDNVLPTLLREGTQRRLAVLFRPLWDRLNSVMPRRLWLWTVQRLQPRTGRHREVSHESLTLDPLSVLRCDARVFRVPAVLDILLIVLKAYMDASGAMLAARCAAAVSIPTNGSSGGGSDVDQDRTAFLSTLVMTQNAAIVQMLYEICLARPPAAGTRADNPIEDPGEMQEARIIVCSFVHLLFINNPLLLKLVNFQGYNHSLISVLVVGIPSMHVCIDFLGELMMQPSLEKQVFGVLLTGHLATRYPIPKMLTAARVALGKMHELAHADVATREAFFLPTFGTLVRICTAFPMLSESTIELLLKIQAMQRAYLAANTDVREPPDGLQHQVTTAFENITIDVLLPNALNV